jgi:poly(3-hydroxybutyrate) depolymerase
MFRRLLRVSLLNCALLACGSEPGPEADAGRAVNQGATDATATANPAGSDGSVRGAIDAGGDARPNGTGGADAGSVPVLDAAIDAAPPATPSGADAGVPDAQSGSAAALAQLEEYLGQPRASRAALAAQAFARVALTRADATSAGQRLWDDFAKLVREERKAEVGATASVARSISLNGKTLRYYQAKTGAEPAGGRSLFISMHGGGNAPAATNDSQWKNQIALVDGYAPKDAIWIAPRAPIDDWNMWFVEGIDALFERLITDMIVFEGINPNKVYINGYSAGGDGVYQLGPRMGERWAGAGMSAGHPNAASPLSLRNVPFAIHVGGNDTAYQRNLKATEWGKRLEMLAAADPGGYVNQWQVHAGRPHWMELDDAVSIPFLQGHTRDPIPRKIVWEQADLPRAHFYWLALGAESRAKGNLIQARYDESGVFLDMVKGVRRLSIRLSDAMLDLDRPVKVELQGKQLSLAVAPRTIANLARTLDERNDPSMLFPSEVSLELP